MSRRSRWTRAVMLVLVFLAGPGLAGAQDVPVVFLHGLMSNADAWRDTAPQLARHLKISEHRISTDWHDWYERQAQQVHAAFGHLPADTIAVGHSNGGIVAREWSRSRGLRGIVTLGTPHEGALLAARGLDLVALNYDVFDLANGIAAVLSNSESAYRWLLPWLATHLAFASTLGQSSAAELLLTLGLAYGLPVLGQMRPGSGYLNGLNSGINLQREALAVPRRVGMVFVAREYWRGGIAVGLKPDSQDAVATGAQVAAIVLEGAAAYVQHHYPWNPTGQWLYVHFLALSQRLRSLDPAWCWAVTDDISCATSHDGIVATPAQFYPAAANVGYYGPPHLRQIREAAPMLEDVLVDHLNVERRTPPPPPIPPPPGPPSRLDPGQSLLRHEYLRSPSGTYSAIYQGDGNLVIYRADGTPTWSSATEGQSAGAVTMQHDGNLVIYDGHNAPVWQSNTPWAPDAYLVMTDEGHLVIFSAGGAPIWMSGGR